MRHRHYFVLLRGNTEINEQPGSRSKRRRI
jgi:hypothetical protein